MKKRIFAGLLTLVMVFTLLPVSALAKTDTGHKIDVTFKVLYVGDEFKIGYNYGTSEKTQFVCQYKTNHNDTAYNNHTIAISDIKAAADRATVNSGYQIVGWSKESNANPKTWPLDKSGTTACNKGTTIYLVAKNPNPTPTKYTYHLIHEFNYVGGTRWDITATTAAESYQLDVNKGKPTRNGYSFAGWADKENAVAAKYFGGEQITLTKDNPTRTIYAVWMPDFELRYDANGGVGAPASQTHTALTPTVNKVTFTVPNQAPTKEDYTFKGWADSATATNAQYKPGDTIDVQHEDSPKTVYAVREKDDSPTPDKPVRPSYDDLKSAIRKIQVTDVSTPSCGTKNYDLIDNTSSNPFNRTITARLDQPGKYDVTIQTAPYVAKYNSDTKNTHVLNDAGQTTLKLVISYKDKKWGLDDGKAEIEVKHTESTPTEIPPKAPTDDELKKLEMAVQVKCVVDNSQQHTEAYGLLGEYDEDYFVVGPKKVGDDCLCEISYVPDPYVAKFNKTFPTLKHIQNDEKIVPVTLIWAGNSWQLKTQGRIYVTEEYTVTFNAYGGFPTPDKQHVKSGEKAVLPVAPTLKGYTFAFWYLGEDEQNATAYDFDTPVTGDITLTAKWNINKYTVTFDSYGGTPVPPKQEVEYGLTAAEPDDPTLKGYTFAFWYLGEDEQNATAYDFDTPVTGDITLTAKWNINKYTVTFDSYGGTPVPPKQEVEYGLTATEPTTAPTKTGYTFDGWYLGDEKYDFSDAVEQNITLRAKWEAIPYGVTYSYVSGTEGADLPWNVIASLPVNKYTYAEGEKVTTAMKPDDVVFGEYTWKFQGWTLNGTAVAPNTQVPMAKGGLNFVGTWIRTSAQDEKYPVTYEYVSGTEGADLPWNVIDSLPVNEYTYAESEKVTTAMKPDDMGFGEYTWKFQGWTLNGTAVAPNTQVPMAKGGLNFVGTWIRTSAQDEKYPVTYEYVSGTEGADLPWNVIDSLPVNEYTYAESEKVTTAMKPDDMGFGEYTWKFQGWTLNGTAVAPNTQVPMAKGGLNFVGTWIRTSAQDEKYPVTYSYVSGVEGVELPEEVKATLPVNKDTYTIGQQVPTAAKPANVTVGDYIWSLKAWKLGDNEIVPNNSVPMVEGGLNFVGIWTREKATVTVTFDANGGTVAPTSKTITKGSTLTLPTPVLSGYSFDGWFTEKTGGTQVNAGATFDKDTTLYAHWTKKSSSGGGGSSSRDYDYTLRYVTNGGKSIASETKSKRWTKDYEDLPMPTRAGYRFDGWYYDSALKNEVTGDVKVNSRTVTLYAGWIGSSVPDSLNGEDHFAYVQGYADGTVRPNTPVTRAQVATILFRLLDESVRKEYLTENNTFTDVASNYWANTAISTMANMGVFKGRTADRFDPNAPITRGEFAAVCARFDDSKVKTTETYSDIDGYWAANEILRAAALGWVQGYQDGSYRPNNSITRAQVVTMINRVLCRMPEKNADLLKGMSSFTDCAEDDWCYLAIQEATNSHDYKTKSGSIHEKWTDLNTAPDWSRFEH